MNDIVDFGAIFKRLAADGERQHHAIIGGSMSGLLGLRGAWQVAGISTTTPRRR
jgi:hypothetical protein